jgi:hypothetical protein
MNEYTDYQSCTDEELIELFLSGDMNASYYLVMVRYQLILYGLIYKQIKCPKEDLEYWLIEFYNDVCAPTLKEAKNKFESIEDKNKVKSWLCRCAASLFCKYPHFIVNADFEDYPDDSDCSMETDFYEHIQLLIPDLIPKIIEYFKTLPPRDLYIILAYLFYENKGKKIYNMDERIAKILQHYGFKISGGSVKTVKCRTLRQAKKYFTEYLKNISGS